MEGAAIKLRIELLVLRIKYHQIEELQDDGELNLKIEKHFKFAKFSDFNTPFSHAVVKSSHDIDQ